MTRNSNDILGIEPYAKAIVQAIDDFFKDTEEKREGSFNVLISAQWGMGKTFILQRIADGLCTRGFKSYIFNPWRYSQSTIAIKRKFLQNLHEEFGGKVNLDSLYEGIEGEKQRDFVTEAIFIVTALVRLLLYAFLISVSVFLILNVFILFPNNFNNFFFLLFSLLRINTNLSIQNYLLETSIIIGILGALVPALKFIFENISIKSKKAEVDSVEQFEEIFSKIISQKRHTLILGFFGLISSIIKWFWNNFLMWDVFFLAWLDEWKIQMVNWLESLFKRLGKSINDFIEKEYPLRFIKTIFSSIIEKPPVRIYKIFKKRVLDKVISSLTENKYPKIVILIDDLDRCEEKEVKNILDGFLTFFERKNCAYVVTADHTVIERYIAKQLKLGQSEADYNQESYSTPKEYLHKIFNLNFLVPSPPKDNLQIFLDETAKSFELKNNAQISDLAYKFFNRNPRAIRRFYTKIKFSIDVAQNLINNPKTEETRKRIAQTVIDKPELKAKIIALEMATPKFFSLITEDPQIAQDGEAEEKINTTKLYFNTKTKIESRQKGWSEQEKNEISIAEKILSSEPFIVIERDVSYEMLVNFSSSIHSPLHDTFDWSQIQQDMEKGNSIFIKIYKGTTEQGREIIRRKALEQYKRYKKDNNENRHLFFKGMTELALASYRKGEKADKTMEWIFTILDELSTEPIDVISKIESIDYSRLLEVFSKDSKKEEEILLRLLSTDPYRKQAIIGSISKVSEVQEIREEDGRPSETAKNIIAITNKAFGTVLDDTISSDYTQILAKIFTVNYKATEESIPQTHRNNFLNSLLVLLVQQKNIEEIKQNLELLKKPENSNLLLQITQKTWGIVMSVLTDKDFSSYLDDQNLTPHRIVILRGISEKISSLSHPKVNKLFDSMKTILSSLPQTREQFNDEQKIAIDVLLKVATQSSYQKSVEIRKTISTMLSTVLGLLTTEEKATFTDFYKSIISNSSNITELKIIKDEVGKLGITEVDSLIDSRIASIKKSIEAKKERVMIPKIIKNNKTKGKNKRFKIF